MARETLRFAPPNPTAEDQEDEDGVFDPETGVRPPRAARTPRAPKLRFQGRETAFAPAYAYAGGAGGGISLQSFDRMGWGNPGGSNIGRGSQQFDPRYWTNPLYRPLWDIGDMRWAPERPKFKDAGSGG